MIDLCLLGTGGTIPLAKRWLTSLILRHQGNALLIDCGEGTQIAAQEASISLKPIELLLITHLHADHLSGLPGLLLSMGNMGKTSPLRIYGPRGTTKVVHALQSIAPGLPFGLDITELDAPQEDILFGDCVVRAFRVQHGIPCYGYSISLERKGKFSPEAAKANDIPLALWKTLQLGEHAHDEATGRSFAPELVMGEKRRGLKVCYCTDTRPCAALIDAAAESDLFICEGMYGDDESLPKALENKHMLFSEAADIAANAGGVRELWLTHFSPALPNPRAYRDQVREIFAPTHIPRDGWKKELRFDDEK